MELWSVEVLDSFPQPDPTFRMGVMIGCDVSQSQFGCFCDPQRGSKVHVALAKVDTIRGEVGNTVT